MGLTETEVRNAKAKDRAYKLSDGHSMYLFVTPAGGKIWRLDYKITTRKTHVIGRFPAMTLRQARIEADRIRALTAQGIDPMKEKKRLRAQAQAEERHKTLTFEKVALAWLETYRQGRKYKTWENARGRLRNHILPVIGGLPFMDIKRSDYAAVLTPLPSETPKSTGHKVASLLKLIEDYGIDHYDLQANRALGLTRNIKASPDKVKHHHAIVDKKTLAHYLPAIETFFYHGKADVRLRYALKILILTGVRVSTMLKAEWPEIDFEGRYWHIPATHEKDGKALDLPLSEQAIELFKGLREYQLSTETSLIFPTIRGWKTPLISVQTLENAVKKVVPFEITDLHGWRTCFVVMCKAHGWPHSLVMQTISHSKPGTAADNAYDRAQHTELKKALVQWYADYLDGLRDCMTLPIVDLHGGALFGI